MRRLFVIAILLFLGFASSSIAANPDAVGVIIGNKNYQGRIPAVSYAHNDAEAIKRYLIDVLGFDPDNVIDLRDATKAQMEAAFGNRETHEGKLWSYLAPNGNSDILVFYSGHGVPGQKSKRGYLLPTDADPDLAEINGYPVDLLYENLDKLKARSKTVLLDACFSGDSHKGMLIRSASPVFIQSKEARVGEGMTVLTAASGSELASWDENTRHGLFTEHFLQGVYGAADEDHNGKVTASEIKAFLDDKMTRAARRQYMRRQTATLLGDGEIVLSSLTPDVLLTRPVMTQSAALPQAQPETVVQPLPEQPQQQWSPPPPQSWPSPPPSLRTQPPRTGSAPIRLRPASPNRSIQPVTRQRLPEPKSGEQLASRPPSLGSAREHYQFAVNLLRDGKYKESEITFRSFLRIHGGHPLAGSANYWLGEIHYVRGQYRKAAEIFLANFQANLKGRYAADSLLKLGMSLARLNKHPEACASFSKLLRDFPNLPAHIRKIANFEMRKSGCN